MELTFATQNPNKAKEINSLLPSHIRVSPLDPVEFPGELPEPFDTLEENAMHKARIVAQKTGKPAFADDSGLEVEALNGAPGVMSARYAGETKNAALNIEKLLAELTGVTNRKAKFRTVIAFVNGKEEKLFEGIVQGKITHVTHGASGFGYDPVFLPDGHEQTFAQMGFEEKNRISHRALAFRDFLAFLETKPQ
jgi:XTP/dITP diphosphohydrolase